MILTFFWQNGAAQPLIRGVVDSLYQRGGVGDFRIVDSGESILDYEHIREFESKIGKAIEVVYGTYAEPTYIKKIMKSISLVYPS
jgi:hypothetical protein